MNAPTLLSVTLALAVLGVGFGLVERYLGRRGGPPWFRREGTATDLAYWFFTPLVARTITRIGVLVAACVVIAISGSSISAVRAEVAAGRYPDLSIFGLGSALRSWPIGWQIAAGFLVADFVGYGWHRAFHRRSLWPFHAVHHSSTRLDWLSSVRVHPVNDVVTRVGQSIPILLLGFDPRVFLLFAPFTTLYALLLHADVGWTYGPFRHVLASPAFHRWHHAADREAVNTNFAGLFPVFDVLFGTFRMPVGERPKALGIAGNPVPARFLASLAWPFHARGAHGRAAGTPSAAPFGEDAATAR